MRSVLGFAATSLALLVPYASAQSIGNWQYVCPPGGDAQSVRASPTAPGVVLAGISGRLSASTSLGGLFRSTDGGSNWSPASMSTFKLVYEVHVVRFGSNGTAWAGAWPGLWRSTDAGATWTEMAIPTASSTEEVIKIEVDPTNPSVVFAGLEQWYNPPVHLVRTTDGGTTWADVTPTLPYAMACQGLAFDPTNTQKVYAAFATTLGSTAFFASTDGGTTWTDRSGGFPLQHVSDLAHDGNKLWVASGFPTSYYTQGLWSSPDEGVSWTNATDPTWPSPAILDIELDPTAPGVVYLGSRAGGVHLSTDAGATWFQGWGGVSASSVLEVSVDPNGNDLWAGVDGTAVWKAVGGATFAQSNEGIYRLKVNSMAANPLNPDELALAVGDWEGGSIFTSLDRGATWTRESGLPPEGFSLVRFAPTGQLYATKDLSIYTSEGLWRRDNPGAWTPLGPDTTPTYIDFYVDAIAFDPADPQKIVMAGQDQTLQGFDPTIQLTTDGGATWSKVWENGGNSQVCIDVVLVPDGTGLTYLASYTKPAIPFGPSQGEIVRSVDGGLNWNVVTTLPGTVFPTRFAVTAALPSRVYLANGGGGVWRSDDKGATWYSASPGYTTGVQFLELDASRPNLVWTAGITGDFVQQSLDGGATFADFGGNIEVGTAGGQGWADDFGSVADQGCTTLLYASQKGAWIEETAGCTLFADTPSVSLSAGGTQTLSLVANADGSAHAGRFYHVLGSFSGTTPGFPLQTVTLPLNVDAWFWWTAFNPNVAPMGNNFNTLDGTGSSVATITVPAGTDPSLAGFTLHSAYHVFDVLPAFKVHDVSNPERLTLAP